MKLKTLFANWKTTLSGLISLFCLVAPAIKPELTPVCLKVAAGATAAGLLVARDGDKSSEQSGAVK